MKRPNFAVSRDELALIGKIVERWEVSEYWHNRKRQTVLMDLCACQNSCPLNLPALLHADDFNFIHDMVGIERHMNRRNGKLEGCFLPRFAITD